MSLSKKQRDQLRALCGEIGDDDGIAPADARRASGVSRRQKDRIKQLRLCEQVRRVVDVCLTDCPDPMLAGLTVASVEPGSSVSHLTIIVSYEIGNDVLSSREVIGRLRKIEGWLRSQIAPAISRKHVPRLSFTCCALDRNPEAHDA